MLRQVEIERALEFAILAVNDANPASDRLKAINQAEDIRKELNITWADIGTAWDDVTVANMIDGIEYEISLQNVRP